MRKLLAPSLILLAAFLAAAVGLLGIAPPAAQAASYLSDSHHPDLVSLLSGFGDLWQSDGKPDLHGTVKDAATLAHNDEMAVWVNANAATHQQLRALQDADYDASRLVATGLGSGLSPLYLAGLQNGSLPLTSSLMTSMLAYAQTDGAKNAYNYPRPYLPSDPDASGAACDPTQANGSSLAGIRQGKTYADAAGDLNIRHVPDAADNSGAFVSGAQHLSAGYGGFCDSASFPSGHSANAYLTGITLATLVPELAPQILARASEMGTDRIVLGMHYPLDVIGGRISGEAEVAARWSDTQYRHDLIDPARRELVDYLQRQCGDTLATCVKNEKPYQDDPFDGRAAPGGTAQVVIDEASAVAAYQERLTYGFPPTGTRGQAPSVPAGAAALLTTAYPALTETQRGSILAQTEIDSGYPLDRTGSDSGSWQRLDLAAAMSATVQLGADGSVRVTATGGAPTVVSADAKPTLTAPDGVKVMAGDPLTLVGAGFTGGVAYRLVWSDDHDTTLARFAAAADGTVSDGVTIPADTAAGPHSLDVLDPAGTAVLSQPLSVTVTSADFAQAVTTRSPDGRTIATVFVDSAGKLGYTVTQNGETVVQRSRLGLVVGGTDWGTDVTLGHPTPRSADTTYPLLGTHDTAADHFTGNTIPVGKGGSSLLGVEVRVFDTGVALRYDLEPGLTGQTVAGEETTFAFDPASTITYQPVRPDSIDDLQGDTFQGVLGNLGQQQITVTPTVQTPGGDEYANVVEADVRDWPAIALNTSASGSISTYYWATDNGKGTFTVSANTLHSPFRVLTIASNLTDLTDSDIVTAVNAPVDPSVFPNGDTGWVRPGVSAWMSLEPNQSWQLQPVPSISKMVDDASAAHMPYVLIEGLMADPSWGGTTAERFANLHQLVQQGLAEPNPVHLWLWTNYDAGAGADSAFTGTIDYASGSPYPKTSLQNPDFRNAWLDLVKQAGVAGVKIDHIGAETETKVNLYADVDRAAAQRQLMVEYHNPLEPTGLDRTYPNEIGREAIRGIEIGYAADQNTRLPFTRYVDGTADYTPLDFSNSSTQNNATWAHEVASTVMFTNPYLQISEDAANIAPGGRYHDLIGDLVAHLPTSWKTSWVLPQSQVGGRLAGVVRQNEDGEYWLSVLATPGSPVTTSIPLDFLPAGTTYHADVYADRNSPSSLSRTTTTVTGKTVLTPTLASGGGYLVRITTKDVDNPIGTYDVSSEADLDLIRQHPTSTFHLTKDITLTKPWTPVDEFSGEIDGNGHTVSGLSIATSNEQAFITTNDGAIRRLGFSGATSVLASGDHSVGIVADANYGTIDQVYVVGGSVSGGHRGGLIAANNYGTVSNSYSSGSATAAWEAGGVTAWNNTGASVTDSYSVATIVTQNANAGVVTGVGNTGATIAGDVALGGSVRGNGNIARLVGVGTPTLRDNLALNTIQVGGKTVAGGGLQGADATADQLAQQSTYAGIGWNFDSVWKWDDALKRPVLRAVVELGGGSQAFAIASEDDLALLAVHPDAAFTVTSDIGMTAPWTPVPVFTGTIDGGGHTIDGLTVDGGASKAFIVDNKGTIKNLGFRHAESTVPTPYVQSTRIAIVAVTNDGTIDQVYTRNVDVEGGWRTAPIAAENNGRITNSYTVDSKVVSNWETGGLVGWNNTNAVVQDDYVAGADVTAVSSNGGILSGYGWAGDSSSAPTKFTGDVVYSGSLSMPASGNKGRINGQEKNGTPSYSNNLALDTATINGSVAIGGTATNKNGRDTGAADLREQETYAGIGWDFDTVWQWDATLGRPVLRSVRELQDIPKVTVATPMLTYQAGTHPSAADLLAAAGATTSAGTLTIDLNGVDFTTPASYTAQAGANNDGTEAIPVPVTIRIVPVIAIRAARTWLSYPQGTQVTAAQLESDAEASLSAPGVLLADLSALNSDSPGSYPVTLTATDEYGFAAVPVTLTVTVTSRPDVPVITLAHTSAAFQAGHTPTSTQVISSLGAEISSGTLRVDLARVNFHKTGTSQITVTGKSATGVVAKPVTATLKVVTVTTIAVRETSVRYPASVTRAITCAGVVAAVRATAGNGAKVTADLTAVEPDVVGDYRVTLQAIDQYGFAAKPVTVTVRVTAAPTEAVLSVSTSGQTYGSSSTAILTATVSGGDGSLTGSVALQDGPKKLALTRIIGQTAVYQLSGTLPVGTHQLSARFLPDERASASSVSRTVTFHVTREAPRSPGSER
jgi:hypothetical protein